MFFLMNRILNEGNRGTKTSSVAESVTLRSSRRGDPLGCWGCWGFGGSGGFELPGFAFLVIFYFWALLFGTFWGSFLAIFSMLLEGKSKVNIMWQSFGSFLAETSQRF